MIAKIRYMLLLLMATVLVISCSKDKLSGEALECEEPVVYNDVRNVISNSCGYSGCHNGINLDNLNSFAGMEKSLNNGSFTQRVLDTDNMPPSNAEGDPNLSPPDPDPTSLTQEEIDLLRCWQQNGYSEF